jgi:hypothetical protein
VTSDGYNLSSDNTCNLGGPGDLNNANPQLGPLQNNGGTTQTMALLTGSPAIDAGNPNGCTGERSKIFRVINRNATERFAGCKKTQALRGLSLATRVVVGYTAFGKLAQMPAARS